MCGCRLRILRNWQNRSFIERTLEHPSEVTALQYDAKRLVCGTVKGQLLLWDPLTLRCERSQLYAHTAAITCLQFDDTKVITGGGDSLIKVWGARDLRPLKTLNVAPEAEVTCLHFDATYLAAGNSHAELWIWRIETGAHQMMPGHQDAISGVQVIGGDKLLSASLDGDIRIWSLPAMDCLHILQDPGNQVRSLQADPRFRIYSGTVSGTVCVW